MKGSLLVLRSDEVIDDVASRGRAPRIAEPFLANKTADYACGIVNSTIAV